MWKVARSSATSSSAGRSTRPSVAQTFSSKPCFPKNISSAQVQASVHLMPKQSKYLKCPTLMTTVRAQMDAADVSRNKEKAIEDAKKTQELTTEECAIADEDPPPYVLTELIGKGSFGRVYKAVGVKSRQLVAVKIISIEDGDCTYPGSNDTFSDILKEVNTLKLLSNAGAKNINQVMDTRLVGQSVWMITEYCAGGSVATLMRPTSGLVEKWIIPILREAAEAVHWVHRQGIIHRDIKCANVFITEAGKVQLGDFGVAGIIQTKFDKRSTVTGTLHWMAPELFDSSTSYGIEVDIWAFGSMAYEAATGLPPNALVSVGIANFGSYLRQNCPRLEGEQYSAYLKDIISYCMAQDPAQRPTIEQVQRHPYVFNTGGRFPTASLSQLVNAYKLWELQGGSRQSLFSAGGAQGPVDDSSLLPLNDDWNFDTLDKGELERGADAQAIRDAYGPRFDSPWQVPNWTTRRRPRIMRHITVPLEQVFDPNSDTNYEDNTRAFYGSHTPQPAADLPLRDDSDCSNVRESLIDLDASLDGSHLSRFVDMKTIRADHRSAPDESDTSDCRTTQERTSPLTPAFSDISEPEAPEISDHRRTQDWKFPSIPLASAGLVFSEPEDTEEKAAYKAETNVGRQSGGRVIPMPRPNRASTLSLIDLDASLVGEVGVAARPSTKGSDSTSTDSDVESIHFDLEWHVLETSSAPVTSREPSIYVSDDVGFAYLPDDGSWKGQTIHSLTQGPVVRLRSSPPDVVPEADEPLSSKQSDPSIPPPPSASVMLARSSPEELKEELHRLLSSLGDHLKFTSNTLANLPPRRRV